MTTVTEQEDERFSALEARSRAADGHFVYAVETTGVFCRPSCPSRKPRRENVRLFDTAREALLSGYRPCKRCRPGPPVSGGKATLEALIEACRRLAAESPAQTRQVAAQVGWSEGHLVRVFKRVLGVTPQQFRRRLRTERARTALSASGSVSETIFAAGYPCSSRFYATVGRELGMPPSTARAGGTGEGIEHVVVPCSLGCLLVAWTGRGVCQVGLADSETTLVQALHARFPRAHHRPGEPNPWVAQLVAAVDHAAPLELPLDIRGTAFQERIWQALRAIPVGETRSYGELARSLGHPGGARAVARACASNTLAVAVPCHRVVGVDGSPTGYRWGVHRKQALLRREAQVRVPGAGQPRSGKRS